MPRGTRLGTSTSSQDADGRKILGLRRVHAYIAAAVAAGVLLVAGSWLTASQHPAPRARGQATSGARNSAGTAGAKATAAATPAGGETAATSKRPTAPAAPGAKLGRVYQPPAATVAMIDHASAQAGSTYSVTFSPYGTGPQGPQAMVVRIDRSVPAKGVRKPFRFGGRNALVLIVPGKTKVSKGGRYAGTLKLVRQGDLLVPQVSGVRQISP